jgi:hypothetical protein
LRDRISPEARKDYARELEKLIAELQGIKIPDKEKAGKTVKCIEGTLQDLYELSPK